MSEDDTSGTSAFDVLQVNKLYYPQVGGIETVVQNIAEGFAARGHTFRVLAAVPRGRGRRESHNDVAVRKVSSLGIALSTPLAPTYPVRLWQEAQNADIVHHHLPNPLGVVSHLLTPSGPRPTVATYHSDIVRQQTVLRAYEPLLKRFLREVDHIMVTSPKLLNHSDYLAPHAHKCSVIPLSIDLEEYEHEGTEEINLPTDSDRPLLLFVGRLNYYKGLEYLIDAMQSIDASLMIVGDGERQDALETQAKDLGIDDRVVFTGYVSQDRLHNYYEAADVFILPSVEPSEAFGVVQLEAMAYETPVVNTSLPTGVPWVSQDGKTGLTVEPRDSDALAVSINDLLSDDKTRKTYGRRARERVETHFSRERMLSQVESVYASVLD